MHVDRTQTRAHKAYPYKSLNGVALVRETARNS